jgi:hypothetical protein
MSPEKKEVLVQHFKELENLATKEPMATRFIRDQIGGVAHVRDDGDTPNGLYLPASNGYRPCYYHYCDSLGYTARIRGRQMKYQWTGEGDEPEVPTYVSFPTYYYYWKEHHPNLKVKGKTEDICGFCFRMAHRHKYKLTTSALLRMVNDPAIAGVGTVVQFRGAVDHMQSDGRGREWDGQDNNNPKGGEEKEYNNDGSGGKESVGSEKVTEADAGEEEAASILQLNKLTAHHPTGSLRNHPLHSTRRVICAPSLRSAAI